MQLDDIDDEIAAKVFRRLVLHLRHRHDAQNIDLMGLAGFCRNCLGDWTAEASGSDAISPLAYIPSKATVPVLNEDGSARIQRSIGSDGKVILTAKRDNRRGWPNPGELVLRKDVEDVTTVVGLVYALFGRVPRAGRSVIRSGI